MGSDDEVSESNVTHYSPPSRSVAPALSIDDRRGSEYGNVFRNGAENYGVLPSAIDPNNPSYNNLPLSAGAPAPRSSVQSAGRAMLMKVIYDKILAPSPSVMQAYDYDVVKPRAPPGAGGTYNVVRAMRDSDDTRASMSITVHDDAPMEVLDDVTLDSSGSAASDSSSAEKRRNDGGGARVAGTGRNQYEAMASRLTLSALPTTTTVPTVPPTLRAPIMRDAKK